LLVYLTTKGVAKLFRKWAKIWIKKKLLRAKFQQFQLTSLINWKQTFMVKDTQSSLWGPLKNFWRPCFGHPCPTIWHASQLKPVRKGRHLRISTIHQNKLQTTDKKNNLIENFNNINPIAIQLYKI
jgi:hypothetical protein